VDEGGKPRMLTQARSRSRKASLTARMIRLPNVRAMRTPSFQPVATTECQRPQMIKRPACPRKFGGEERKARRDCQPSGAGQDEHRDAARQEPESDDDFRNAHLCLVHRTQHAMRSTLRRLKSEALRRFRFRGAGMSAISAGFSSDDVRKPTFRTPEHCPRTGSSNSRRSSTT